MLGSESNQILIGNSNFFLGDALRSVTVRANLEIMSRIIVCLAWEGSIATAIAKTYYLKHLKGRRLHFLFKRLPAVVLACQSRPFFVVQIDSK